MIKALIKYTFLLIFIGLLGLLIYQNLDYFMQKAPLVMDLKTNDLRWVTPEMPTLFYIGICFLAGLLLSSFRALLTRWRLKKTIKNKDDEITALQGRIDQLRTELDVFQHDPYIKNGLAAAGKMAPIPMPPPETIDHESPDTLPESEEKAGHSENT